MFFTTNTNYWIAFKKGEYIAGTDEFGYPLHTNDEKEAWRFYDLNTAMSFLAFGYTIIKK